MTIYHIITVFIYIFNINFLIYNLHNHLEMTISVETKQLSYHLFLYSCNNNINQILLMNVRVSIIKNEKVPLYLIEI